MIFPSSAVAHQGLWHRKYCTGTAMTKNVICSVLAVYSTSSWLDSDCSKDLVRKKSLQEPKTPTSSFTRYPKSAALTVPPKTCWRSCSQWILVRVSPHWTLWVIPTSKATTSYLGALCNKIPRSEHSSKAKFENIGRRDLSFNAYLSLHCGHS